MSRSEDVRKSPRVKQAPGAGPRAVADPASGRVVAVASPSVLARAAAEVAAEVERAVAEGRRADRTLSEVIRRRRDLAPPDARFASLAAFALFRWRGWIEPLGAIPIEERLLLSVLLESDSVPSEARVWARMAGRDPNALFSLADAPDWGARSEGFRRLVGGGREIGADPWRLFPPWFREHLPLPPGRESPKLKYLALLWSLQARAPLWVRVQGESPERVWNELHEAGVKPWIHRKLTGSARLGPEADVYHLPPFLRGSLEIQDLAAQAVGLVCRPDPGERWWDVCAGAGGKALHLAALMNGKGAIVATDTHEARLKEAVRRARRSPFRNVGVKAWDGKHVVGKAGRYDGVLVDAPCSGIGTWRRNPEARWTLEPQSIARLAELQGQILNTAAPGVRAGGCLVYSACTLTPSETTRVIDGFLASHPEFRLDPFPHPWTGETTDGRLQIWPQDSDSDAMFVARLARVGDASKRSTSPSP
jgi:16S rRNA (cytosine967-C5)-methyltransferase